MIKTAVYTYYENPNHPTWSGFSSLKDLQEFVSLSVLHSKRFIGKVKLVCNTTGKTYLGQCGFDEIDTCLDSISFNKNFWAYPKIYAYSIQKEPFLHIDLDAILWEKPSQEYLNAPACFQHKELFHIHRAYPQVLDKYKKHGEKVKINKLKYAYCCGFTGGNDLGYFKSWKALVDRYIQTTNFGLVGYHSQNHFFEQYFAASVAYERGISERVQFLCGQEIYKKGQKLSFAHLWGASKKNRENIDKCLTKSKLVSCIENIPKYFLTYPITERIENSKKNIREHQFINTHIIQGVVPGQEQCLIEELNVKVEKDISSGSKRAFLAHRNLWKICKNNEWSMVVEDDAYFRDGWQKKLRQVPDYIFKAQSPTVIKLCVFNPESGDNEHPPSTAKKIKEGFYKLEKGMSAVCYIANKAYFDLMWDKCDTINGITQDVTTQMHYDKVQLFGFFPNIVVNRHEIKSIRNQKLGGWSISEELLLDLMMLPKGTKMVELGSGEGTKHLVSHFNLTSIEQNEKYLNLHHDNYIYAPIKDNWFDLSAFEAKDLSCEVLLVDAPFGASRRGVIDNFKLFNAKTVIFDDVNREKDMEIAKEFCAVYNYKMTVKGTDKKHAICTVNYPPTLKRWDGLRVSTDVLPK